MNTVIRTTAAATLMLGLGPFAGAPALSQGDGGNGTTSSTYFGFSVGAAHVPDFDDLDDLSGLSADSTAATLSVYFGDDVHPNVSLEAAILRSADYDFSASGSGASLNLSANATIVSASVLGRVPSRGTFSPFARLGAHFWTGELCGVVSAGGASAIGCVDDDGFGLHVGLGADIALTETMSLRSEYTFYDDVNDAEIHLLSLGLNWRL